MRIRNTHEKEKLVAGQISTDTGRKAYSEAGGTATYLLENNSPKSYPSHIYWDLGLSQLVSIDLEAEMGAGAMVLDLVDLELKNLTVKQGVGDMEIHLPVGEAYQVEVSQAIGQIQVTIPEDAPLRLEVSRAITALDVPHDFTRQGDYYLSPNYAEADEAIDLQISQAIGNIEVEYSR